VAQINAGFGYLEVKCLGVQHAGPIALRRSHLVALRTTKITVSDPPSTWWPGER
jgi:hypothetical protein